MTTRWLAGLWLSVLVTLSTLGLLAVTTGVWPGLPVRTNIMELLPSLRDDPVVLDALERSQRGVSRKLLVLVGDTDPTRTAAATALVERHLQQQDFASPATFLTDSTSIDGIGLFYFEWRHVLLSDTQRQLVQRGEFAALQAQLTETLYSPVSGVNARLLENDPLLTFYHFMRDLPTAQGQIQFHDGQLQVRGEDRGYRVLLLDMQQDVFDMKLHPAYQQWLDGLQQDLQQQFPHTELLLMGAIQHAVWGANSARHEVTTIGNGSLLGIVLLLWLVFRHRRALLLSLLPLGTGVVAGLLATLLCFGQVHLITLVFGSSVIGVAMDYSLHYLSEHFREQQAHDSRQQVFAGITLAMLTSVMAYTAIGFAPFPVLRQVALFSCTGLFMAWLTVVSLYGRLMPPACFHDPRYLHWSGRLDSYLRRQFARPVSRFVIALLAVLMLPGVLNLRANDDLRLLQAPEPGISAMEKKVRELTGIQTTGRFLLFEGKTPEELLQRQEALRDWLQDQPPATSVSLLSDYWPSRQHQQDNIAALRQLHGRLAPAWQESIGLPASVMARATERLDNPPRLFGFEEVGNSPLLPLLERFQFGQTARGWMALALPDNPDGTASLAAYAKPLSGVHWLDPVAEISALFKHYREQTGWMMVFAYAAIAALLCWRYGVRSGWRVLLAPALAAWVTLGLLGHAGVSLNLFHLLALLLVLGVGIDYSIFFAESHSHRDSTMLAVLLSTLTTLLSFGLLALSSTAAIRSFGTVVCIGMVCALLFSPLAQHAASTRQLPP